MLDFKTFYAAVRYLKQMTLAHKPIKVRRLPLDGYDGLCEDKDDYFLVKINKNLSEHHSIDVLLHEIAHAEAWGKEPVHGKVWAISYGRLYRIWEKHACQGVEPPA